MVQYDRTLMDIISQTHRQIHLPKWIGLEPCIWGIEGADRLEVFSACDISTRHRRTPAERIARSLIQELVTAADFLGRPVASYQRYAIGPLWYNPRIQRERSRRVQLLEVRAFFELA